MSCAVLPAFLVALLLGSVHALATGIRRAVNPVVASTTSYGSLDNGGLNRDSCTSTAWSGNNVLWVCRDTQPLSPSGLPTLPVVVNTASYSTKPSATTPGTLHLTSPQGFGSPFYALESDECPTAGVCSDGTRWVGWPDTAPVVVFQGPGGAVNAYAFIARQHLSGLSLINTPSYTLYHVGSATSDTSMIPSTSVDVSSFWGTTQIGYGSAASVVSGSYAYLYGATPSGNLAVARAALTGFLGALNSKSLYEYYVNGAWTTTTPSHTASGIALANTRSAQGTVYYSNKWASFVWIGGDGFPNANFYVSTAPAPEGPWTSPTLFYSGAVGTGSLPAYSAVAHPGLTDGTGNYIFLTWTRTTSSSGGDIYDQPLVRVNWA
ncbi:hypothetical protein K488DRAFT_41338 [Vararia minispora EC-137]|uniref:Uncharacterized protein n=1 Tax=Vararia minispora EC-137 TaxID=1314806 RepID=A0ACB8QXV3_9AGAM|nr:hypothetical protein K488DRAFT_41338 [Vararia minispora EC-137]